MSSLWAVLLLGALLFILPELLRRRSDHYTYPDIPAGPTTSPSPVPDEHIRAATLSMSALDHDAVAPTAVEPPPVTTTATHDETPPDLRPLVNGFIMAEILSPPVAKRCSRIPYRRYRR